jgi:hypothetical protein
MASILVKIFADGAVGSVILRNEEPGGQHWGENTPGERFIGRDHRGNFQMGTYGNAGSLFLEEPNRDPVHTDRQLYPTLPVLVLNNFPYPNAGMGAHGSGDLQDSSRRRRGFVTWQVTNVW